MIENLNAPQIEIYTKLNEKQVKKIYEPDEGAFICESIRVIERAIEAGYEPMSFFIEEDKEEEVSRLISKLDVPVYVAPYKVMRDITGYSLTGGVLSAMRRKPLGEIQEFIASHNKIVMLDDIENPTNVGAIFRCAAALGADGIILTKDCADPLYRRAARVSMGTVFQIDWTMADDSTMMKLSQFGFESYALALSDNAVSLRECNHRRDGKSVVILGNEDHGISQDIMNDCNHVVMIPMAAGVDSLNVAAASSVAFWEIFN